MTIRYPIECADTGKRTEYLYRAQELLRKLHNSFSEWLHKGLDKNQYDKFPEKIKAKYPYVAQLSQETWRRFQNEDFTPRSDKICQEICVQRAELKKSTAFTIDIGEI